MGSKIDWTELLETFGEQISNESLEVFKENKDFFSKLTKEQLTLLLHYVSGDAEEELNTQVYSLMLRQLSDEDFLKLREDTTLAAQAWNELDNRKRKVANDLLSRIGRLTANILIKHLLLLSL